MWRPAATAAVVVALSVATAVTAVLGTPRAPTSEQPNRPASPAPPVLLDRWASNEPPAPPELPAEDLDGLRGASTHLAELGARFEADARVSGFEVGISVWQVDPGRELLAVGDARPLMPASVQKLATAAAALEQLDPTFAFETRVVTDPGVASGTPEGVPLAGATVGDLTLVGGGDPTLGRSGPHSLDGLAAQVHAAGIRRVTGDIVVDAGRWSDERAARGWLDWQQPRFIGWMSALMADGNQWQRGIDAAEPERANGEWFLAALQRRGITVDGGVRRGPAPPGAMDVAAVHSSARDDLVAAMVMRSDNTIAEALVRELGWRATGQGTAESGTAVVSAVVADLVADGPGDRPGRHESDDADGSGLSRQDRRSAGQWRALLVGAQRRPWWPVLRDALPEAARTGTLAGRFGGTAAAGNVRAKTGSTVPVRALSGVLTASDGSEVAFAVVVNGDDTHSPIGAEGAIDELLVALANAPIPAAENNR